MADTDESQALADMMALKIDGPAIVILRPRYHMSRDSLEGFRESFKRARLHGELAAFPQVTFLILPCDFDVMVMGDVELEQAGLARLAPSEAA